MFELGCNYSGQVLSFQKILGQLQEAGNTTTLAHYLKLLSSAGLIKGLSKYAGESVRQRASSPKLLVLNTALMSAQSSLMFNEAKSNSEYWGRLVETAIRATLANGILSTNLKLFYWSGRSYEVDFILSTGKQLIAFEVKNNLKKTHLPGITKFSSQFPVQNKILIGANGIPICDFFKTTITYWFN